MTTYSISATAPKAVPRPQEVSLRPYESKDFSECREIFTEGMQQITTPIMELVYPRYLKFSFILSIFVVVAAFRWSLWIIGLYIIVCIILTAMLYINIYLEVMKFVSYCLNTDLVDIDKSYMYNKGSCMWVAEYNGKVVGMVGLIHSANHEAGVAELQRMSVSQAIRRKGIGSQLIKELIQFAKEQNYNKIILTTTAAQYPAMKLYKKWGFQLANVSPHPQKVLEELSFNCYELEL